MAITWNLDTPRSKGSRFSGSQKVRYGTGNAGTGYTTGGVVIGATDLKTLGLRTLDHLDVSPAVAAADRVYTWDKANSKLLVFTALGTEAAGASDQSSKTFRFKAEGT